MAEQRKIKILFSEKELSLFAKLSSDKNPLHTDEYYARKSPYGQRIVFGILSALACLKLIKNNKFFYPTEIQVDFDNPVFLENEYTAVLEQETDTMICIWLGSQNVTNLRVKLFAHDQRDLSWETFSISSKNSENTISPMEYEDQDFLSPITIKQNYQISSDLIEELIQFIFGEDTGMSKKLIKILCLCSYIVGMEFPGKRALFSRLRLEINESIPEACDSIYFSASQLHYDQHYRMLDIGLKVGCSDSLIARGTLKAFVLRKIARVPLEIFSQKLGENQCLKGKVGLVIGGSRGLGAAFVQALALKGCTVVLNYNKSTADAVALQNELNQTSASLVHLFQGDTAKPEVCNLLKEYIVDTFNRLDFIILNAFLPPLSKMEHLSYIANNKMLFQQPVSALQDILKKNNGTVIGISSVFVKEGPKELSHYIQAKKALEDFLRENAKEYPDNRYMIVRPPQLLTDMNNTPAGWLSAISPDVVAIKVVKSLCKNQNSIQEKNNLCIIEDFDDTKSIRITATFTANPIQAGLDFWLKQWQWPMRVDFSPYNQILQDLYNLESDLHSNLNGLNVILTRFEDWYRFKTGEDEVFRKGSVFTDSVKEFYEEYVEELIGALKFYNSHHKGVTLFVLCPDDTMYLRDRQWNTLFKDMEYLLTSEIDRLSGISVVKTEDYHELYFVQNIFDNTGDILGHIPFTSDYFAFLATLIVRRYFSKINKKFKVIVLDCDNTLWKGVVGEDGTHGIEISSLFEAWQNTLIDLSRKGYLLCLCSKNNPDDVTDVFEHNPLMKLRMEHIVHYRINWKMKSENLYDLAKELNLGIDSFIFIDDNPAECEEVRNNCPEALTLLWPDHEQEAWKFIKHIWVLDHFDFITKEDSERTLFYKANINREQLKLSSNNYSDFLKNLNLSVRISELDRESLNRASQLTNRTNQFNFNPIRRNETEMLSLYNNPSYSILRVDVDDKFGSYGFVGLMICRQTEGILWVDSLMLSCRVLGRGVKYQMLQYLGKLAKGLHLSNIVFTFVKTQKNHVAYQFIERLSSELPGVERIQKENATIEYWIPADLIVDYELKHVDYIDTAVNEKDKLEKNRSDNNPDSLRELEKILGYISRKLTTQKQIWASLNEGSSTMIDLDKGNPNTKRISIQDTIKNVIAKVTDFMANEIDFKMPIEDYHFESMKKIEISSELIREYPQLSPTFLFEYPDLQSVVQFLKQHYDDSTADNKLNVKEETTYANEDDIAIIGINAYLPQSYTMQDFWENMVSGNSCITEVPKNRWDTDAFYNPNSNEAGKSHCKWGGFLENVESFDNSFFGISPKEAEVMDPQQRLFLQVVWGMIEDAGYRAEDLRRNTGVFVGVISGDYGIYLNQTAEYGFSPYRWGDYYQIANRISYFLNLKGPSMAIDTACSSSGTALYFACQSLRANECQTAIVGGVNLILHPSRYIQYTKMGLLTSEDKCRPFSADAKGTIMGEGVGAILLKPLKAAQKDRDHIYGIIKSCAINSGGKTNGFTVPNPKAHSDLIKDALHKAKVESSTINYIEAHGTGTIVGDPIEINGISDAFSWGTGATHSVSPCAIGTVKSNIGHLESAAAIAGMMKILLQMKYRKLVPSINASPINSQVLNKEKFCKVQQELAEWVPVTVNGEHGTLTYPRRAGVSSFGAGGSNFHAILEEYTGEILGSSPNNKPNVILFSAKREKALQDMVRNLRDYIAFEKKHQGISDDNDFFNSMAYTLQVGRNLFSYRLAIIAETVDDLIPKLDVFLTTGKCSDHIVYGVCEADSYDINWNEDGIEREYFKSLFASGQMKKLVYLWLKGVSIDWDFFYADPKPVRVSLPSYPFEKKIFPLKSIINATRNANEKLYEKVFSPLIKSDLYQLQTGLRQFPFLIDHQVNRTIIVPGAFSLALVLTCLMNEYKLESFVLGDITFRKALLLERNSQHLTQVAFDFKEDTKTIEVYVDQSNEKSGDKEWLLYTKGQYDGILHDKPGSISITSLQSQCPVNLFKEEFYKNGVEKGFLWGPGFQWIEQVWLDENEVLAKIAFKSPPEAQFVFPPSVLDACLQPYIFALEKHCKKLGIKDTYIPFSIEKLKMFQKPTEEIYTYIKFDHTGEVHKEYFVIDCKITNLQGKIICEIDGLRLKQVQQSLFKQTADIGNYLYKPHWETRNGKDWNQPADLGKSIVVDLSNHSNSFAGVKDILSHHYNACEYRHEDHSSDVNTGTAGDFVQGFSSLFRSTSVKCVILLYDGSKDIQLLGEAGIDVLYERTVLRCFQLLKVIASSTEGQSFHIIVATLNAQSVMPSETQSPIGSALQGFAKVLNSENANIHIRCIDFTYAALKQSRNETELLHDWCKKLFSGMVAGFEEVAVREDIVFGKGLVQIENSETRPGASLLKVNRVYMLIGGSGGLGFELSMHLVKKWNSTLVWVGRKSQQQVQDKITKIKSLGGKVIYIEADAKDYLKLEESFARIKKVLPEINGVFHAALVLKDSMFANMKEADLTEVFDTKAKTMMNVLKLLDSYSLDFVASFSSECSFRGSPAQANYVVACRFLDAYLLSISAHKNIPVRIINWGYWGETGIVATPEYQKRLEAIGLLPFNNEEGIQLTEKILGLYHPQLLAVKSAPIYAGKVGIHENCLLQAVNQEPYSLSDELSKEIGKFMDGYIKTPILNYYNEFRQVLEGVPGITDKILMEAADLPQGSIKPQFDRYLKALKALKIKYGNTSESIGHDISGEVQWSEAARTWITMLNIAKNYAVPIVSNRIKFSDVFFPDGTNEIVEGIYKYNPLSEFFNQIMAKAIQCLVLQLVKKVGRTRKVRILEFGAGTGSTTRHVLRGLKALGKDIEYVYSDVSAHFLSIARDQFSNEYAFVNYQLFNLNGDIEQQNMESASFDIILGTNAIHISQNISTALINLKRAMTPSGYLLINELTFNHDALTLTFGLFTGWWEYEDENMRIKDSPLISLPNWRTLLEAYGFTNVQAFDFPDTFMNRISLQHIIVCQSNGEVLRSFNKPEKVMIKTSSKLSALIKSEKTKTGSEGIVEILRKMPMAMKNQYVEEMLKDQLKRILLISEDEPISNTIGFQDIGVDSLLAIQFRDALTKITGQKLSTTVIYDYPNIKSMAAYILENIRYDTALPEVAATIQEMDKPIVVSNPMDALLLKEDIEDIEDIVKQIHSMSEEEAINELINELTK